jgi:hypothetical protein
VSYEQVMVGCEPVVLAVADRLVIRYMYVTTELLSARHVHVEWDVGCLFVAARLSG